MTKLMFLKLMMLKKMKKISSPCLLLDPALQEDIFSGRAGSMFSGCLGDFVFDVADAESRDHVALTAGFCSPAVAALPSLIGVGGEHDGGDAVDGVPLSVSVPGVAEPHGPEPWVHVHGLVSVTMLPVPLLSPLPPVDISPGDGVPKHPGVSEVGVVPLLPVPLLAVLLSVLLTSRTLIWHSAGASSSTPPPPPAPVSEPVHLVSFLPPVARDDNEKSPPDIG